MKKQMLIFGAMAVGALALVGKRTYDAVKASKEQQNIIEIEVETPQEDSRK